MNFKDIILILVLLSLISANTSDKKKSLFENCATKLSAQVQSKIDFNYRQRMVYLWLNNFQDLMNPMDLIIADAYQKALSKHSYTVKNSYTKKVYAFRDEYRRKKEKLLYINNYADSKKNQVMVKNLLNDIEAILELLPKNKQRSKQDSMANIGEKVKIQMSAIWKHEYLNSKKLTRQEAKIEHFIKSYKNKTDAEKTTSKAEFLILYEDTLKTVTALKILIEFRNNDGEVWAKLNKFKTYSFAFNYIANEYGLKQGVLDQ